MGLRLWRAKQTQRVGRDVALDGGLATLGIAACKADVFALVKDAILGLMRLNFLSTSTGAQEQTVEPARRLSALIDAEAVETQVCSWGASG